MKCRNVDLLAPLLEHIPSLYEGYLLDLYGNSTFGTMRTTPASRAELMNLGLSDEDVDAYLDLFYRLYGCGFIANNALHGNETGPDIQTAWTELCNFCFDNGLIAVPDGCDLPALYFQNSAYLCWPLIMIQDDGSQRNVPPASVDEFRWYVEMRLAGLDYPWYLALRYGVYLVPGAENRCVVICAATDAKTLEPVSAEEIHSLLMSVVEDKRKLHRQLQAIVCKQVAEPILSAVEEKCRESPKDDHFHSRTYYEAQHLMLEEIQRLLRDIISRQGAPSEQNSDTNE